jgi:hemolysin activation/secretion protein
MLKIIQLMVALLASVSAWAEQPPSAASQMQQIHPLDVPLNTKSEIQFEPGIEADTPPLNDEKIVVNHLNISGAQIYSADDLRALTGFKAGSQLSLSELRTLATKIADFYHRHGYFVA